MSTEYKDQDSKGKSDDYRLVVLRADDLEEVRSVQLSLSNIYIIISSVFLILTLLLVSLIVFTPLKKLIPGYGQIHSNDEFIALVKQVDELSGHLESQEIYLGAIKKLITSNGDTSNAIQLSTIVTDSIAINSQITNTTASPNPVFNREAKFTPQAARNGGDADNLWRTIEAVKPQAPLEGLISSEFDPQRKHYGVDILAPANTAVRTILDGHVISSGWDLETGYTIGVLHDGEILSFYKHNSILLKEKGTFVSAGEAIAIIGNTGTLSSGPHLHFEFWHHGKPINPKDIINFN